jgi:hypothetical protein
MCVPDHSLIRIRRLGGKGVKIGNLELRASGTIQDRAASTCPFQATQIPPCEQGRQANAARIFSLFVPAIHAKCKQVTGSARR